MKNRFAKIAYVLMALAFVVSATVAEAAITVDRTATVTASGALAGSTSLSADVASISYGTNTTDRFATAPKIKLTYTSNYNPWKIMVSTNNTQIPLKAVQY
ncbi:MAG: hypothetical protein PHT32_08535, partial [Candidatus Omnitrophica bacterium]|nr:hypothetical protein [Candidatus Omnitrophota bacterium]